MSLSEDYQEVSSMMAEVSERAKDVKRLGSNRSEISLEENVDLISSALADVGVCLFEMRHLSWRLLVAQMSSSDSAAVQHGYRKLRDELKENMYSLSGLSQALQERTRSIRALYLK